MKIKEAIKVLKMMNMEDEVELNFPNAFVETYKSPIKPMTEGAMAELPMYPERKVGMHKALGLGYCID